MMIFYLRNFVAILGAQFLAILPQESRGVKGKSQYAVGYKIAYRKI
jgi:hypothetical protein